MATQLSKETLQKELIAQKKRASALAYLDKHGCGPGKVESVLNSKGESAAIAEDKKIRSVTGDNTLDLLLHRKVANSSEEKKKEISSRESLIKLQEDFRKSKDFKEAGDVDSLDSEPTDCSSLPPNWQPVIDKSSGQTYYWNTVTKETVWDRPKVDPAMLVEAKLTDSPASDLPAGWVEVLHAATKQAYFVHQATGEKRWTRPSEQSLAMDKATSSANSVTARETATKRANKDTAEQEREKRRRLLIDPLDPTGGMGRWGDGISSDGKMADSTASGPLWQQRPYPAPGMALKNKDKNSAKESNIGPVRPSK